MRFLSRLAVGLAALCATGCAEGDSVGAGFKQVAGSGGAGGSGSGSKASSSSGAVSTGSASSSSAGTAAHSSSASGNPCPDDGPGEPNDTEASAVDLGIIDDCDGSGSSVKGTIAGPDDVDWYKYEGNDTFGCVVDATRTFVAGTPLRLCKFAQCKSGNVDFGCPAGTSVSSSPDGRPGCCAQDGFTIGPNCPGIDDDAYIYIRIDNPNADACVEYTLDYHY